MSFQKGNIRFFVMHIIMNCIRLKYNYYVTFLNLVILPLLRRGSSKLWNKMFAFK